MSAPARWTGATSGATCREAGAEWMVVEHDKPADPAQTARASFAFLRNIED